LSISSSPKLNTFPLHERRTYDRLGFDCPIRWNNGGVDRYGWARDVSDGDAGFTVRALGAPQLGDKIRLIFELCPDREWVVDECAIVKRCHEDEYGLCHVGVRLNPLVMD